jgi:Cft2 family RNA processing exonuclease
VYIFLQIRRCESNVSGIILFRTAVNLQLLLQPGPVAPQPYSGSIAVEFHPQGIHLPQLGLWLDPRNAQEVAWISHAHSDHATGLHEHALGTPQTLTLYRMRWPGSGARQILQPLEFGQPLEWRGARLTAVPAGHILGASQLMVEMGGERLIYTGDMKLSPPLCGQPAEIVRCDRLILESTFGLPIYHFLSREDARARIVRFARQCLEESAVPVFLGYPLGRGQEIAHVLCEAGIPVAVHGAIARFIPVYEEAGYGFPGWRRYEAGAEKGRDCALVVTPGMKAHFEASVRDCRIAYVSGWAALSNARARSGASELIAYSDHADFEELLQFAGQSGARRVDLVHGYTEALASILRGRGIEAHAVSSWARPEETEPQQQEAESAQWTS